MGFKFKFFGPLKQDGFKLARTNSSKAFLLVKVKAKLTINKAILRYILSEGYKKIQEEISILFKVNLSGNVI